MKKLTFSEARHLVARTGLGAEWGGVRKLEGMTRERAVDFILNPAPSNPRPAPYMSPWNKLEPMRVKGSQSRKNAWVTAQQEGQRLQGWWIIRRSSMVLRARWPVSTSVIIYIAETGSRRQNSQVPVQLQLSLHLALLAWYPF